MTSGYFNTDATNLIIVSDDATSTEGNDTSFVDGPMRKVGNDTFVYPLGDGSVWARLQISAPSNASDAFTAEYFFTPYTDTTTMALSPSPILNNVSKIEYWTSRPNHRKLKRRCDPSLGGQRQKRDIGTFFGFSSCKMEWFRLGKFCGSRQLRGPTQDT